MKLATATAVKYGLGTALLSYQDGFKGVDALVSVSFVLIASQNSDNIHLNHDIMWLKLKHAHTSFAFACIPTHNNNTT